MDTVCSRNKLSSVWLSSDAKIEEKVESRGVKDGEAVKWTRVCFEGLEHHAKVVLAWWFRGQALL